MTPTTRGRAPQQSRRKGVIRHRRRSRRAKISSRALRWANSMGGVSRADYLRSRPTHSSFFKASNACRVPEEAAIDRDLLPWRYKTLLLALCFSSWAAVIWLGYWLLIG